MRWTDDRILQKPLERYAGDIYPLLPPSRYAVIDRSVSVLRCRGGLHTGMCLLFGIPRDMEESSRRNNYLPPNTWWCRVSPQTLFFLRFFWSAEREEWAVFFVPLRR